jgi:hypothetical protein
MPVLVTPVSTVAAVNAPINGEAGDAGALISTSLQPITNQLQRERDRIRVGSTADMAAATGVVAGDIWVTAAEGAYLAYSETAGLGDFWEVACTGTSGIYWGHIDLESTLRANRGIVHYGPITGLDTTPNGKIPVAHLTNRYVGSQLIAGTERLDTQVNASQSLVIPTHSGVHTSAVVGDIIDGSVGPIRLLNNASSPGTAYAYLRIRATDAFGSMGELQSTVGEVQIIPGEDITVTIPFRHVVQAASVATVTMIQLVIYASTVNGMQAIGRDITSFHIGTMTIHRP